MSWNSVYTVYTIHIFTCIPPVFTSEISIYGNSTIGHIVKCEAYQICKADAFKKHTYFTENKMLCHALAVLKWYVYVAIFSTSN